MCRGGASWGAPARAKGCSPDFAPVYEPRRPFGFPRFPSSNFLGASAPEIKAAKMEYYLLKISGGEAGSRLLSSTFSAKSGCALEPLRPYLPAQAHFHSRG